MEKKQEKFRTVDMIYVAVGAALIAVCAFVTVPVGAVPVTLQTLGVCLTAGLLGAKRGTLSVLVYILLGAAGVPVFAGFKGGAGVLLGATGGYIIGFLFTALLVGFAAQKTKKLWALMLAMAAGVLVCYAFGTAWFILVYSAEAKQMTLSKTLALCVTPFLLPDAVKIAAAAVLTNRLRDKILQTERG